MFQSNSIRHSFIKQSAPSGRSIALALKSCVGNSSKYVSIGMAFPVLRNVSNTSSAYEFTCDSCPSESLVSRSLSGIRKHKLGLAVGDTLSSAKIGSGKPGAPHFCLRTHARPFFAAYAGLFPLGSLRHLQGSP